jgi:hypothetical protein
LVFPNTNIFVVVEEKNMEVDKFEDLDRFDFYDYNELLTYADEKHNVKNAIGFGEPDKIKEFLDDKNFKSWYQNPNIQRIFKDPYFNVFPKSPKYGELASKTLRGTNMDFVLAPQQYRECAWNSLFELKTGISKIEQNESMAHGNFYEPTAIALWWQTNSKPLIFYVGNVFSPDPELKEILASSPDAVPFQLQLSIEVKSPDKRSILKQIKLHELNQLKILKDELLADNFDPRKYYAIVNFPIEFTQLLDDLRKYWHQMQLQMHCLNLEKNYCLFQQFSTEPNELLFLGNNGNYKPVLPGVHSEALSFYTETKVLKDENWIWNNKRTFMDAADYIFTRVEKFKKN